MGSSLKRRLTEIFLDEKILSPDQLATALHIQRARGGRLSQILVSEGFVSERDLMLAVSQQLHIPPITLTKYTVDPQVARLVPESVARRYQILPVSRIGQLLTIAMVDPLDVFALDQIRGLTGYELGLAVTTEAEMQQALDHCYGETTNQEIRGLIADIASTRPRDAAPTRGPGGGAEVAGILTHLAPAVKAAQTILTEGVRAHASDVFIEPLSSTLRVRFRIDGVLRDVMSPPRAMHGPIVSRIKVMAGLDIAEHRLPQDGRIMLRVGDRDVDYRVSIVPAVMGEKVVLRVLDKGQAPLDLERLGFGGPSLEAIRAAARRPYGMILTCGPTGSGKSTTLYAILRYLDSPDKNIVTVEDPIEYELPGMNQVGIRPEIGLTFANALRYILRQDPNVIMIGEMRDAETVDIAIKSALTGHLVLSTLHTNTAASSIVRLMDMGVEPFLMTASITLVLAQRLVRRICPRCKEPQALTDRMHEVLGLTDPAVTCFRGRGCQACGGTGYRGRIGLLEAIRMTPQLQGILARRFCEAEVRRVAREDGMRVLREDGIAKVAAGITTVDEVLRVTVEEPEEAPADPRGAAA